MKKYVSVLISMLMIISCFTVPAVFAEQNMLAVIVKEDLQLKNNSSISGNSIINDGDVEISDGAGVDGVIYATESVRVNDKGNHEVELVNGFDNEKLESLYPHEYDLEEYKDLELKNKEYTLEAGCEIESVSLQRSTLYLYAEAGKQTYYHFDELNMKNDSSIEIVGDGSIHLCVDSIKADSHVTFNEGKKSSFVLCFTGEEFKVDDVYLNGVLYAPESDVIIGNKGMIEGAVIADSLILNGTVNGRLDPSLFPVSPIEPDPPKPVAEPRIRVSYYLEGIEKCVASMEFLEDNGEVLDKESIILDLNDLKDTSDLVQNRLDSYDLSNYQQIGEAKELYWAINQAGTSFDQAEFLYKDTISFPVIFSNEGIEKFPLIKDEATKAGITEGNVLYKEITVVFLKSDTPEQPEDPDREKNLLEFRYAYLYGYEGGACGYNDSIQRDATAAILYRILKQNNQLNGFVPPETPTYFDLVKGGWSFNAMEYMSSIGAIDSGDSFYIHPTKHATRVEVAKMIVLSTGIKQDEQKQRAFGDLDMDDDNFIYLKIMSDHGLMKGDGNNSNIRPYDTITRAEYVTIVNRLLGRDSRYEIDSKKNPFADVNEETEEWIYENVLRAANGYNDDADSNGIYKINDKRRLPRESIDYD